MKARPPTPEDARLRDYHRQIDRRVTLFCVALGWLTMLAFHALRTLR